MTQKWGDCDVGMNKTWSPLYYTDDQRGPIPSPQGDMPPLVEPPVSTTGQLLQVGIEAWLGYHAVRREECQVCVPCNSASGQAMLDFYLTSVYVGAYWFTVQYVGPDDQGLVPWANVQEDKAVDGMIGQGSALADYKTLHLLYEDGRIQTRSGKVAPAPEGETYGDQGSMVASEAGIVSHNNVRAPRAVRGWGARSVLVTWDEKEIQLTPAIKVPTVDAPDITLWAYANYAFGVPNVWRQEHP